MVIDITVKVIFWRWPDFWQQVQDGMLQDINYNWESRLEAG